MAGFFNTEQKGTDARLHAPATARNRDAILAVLKDHLPGTGTLVAVAEGTGEHACHFAPHFPATDWLPTDIDPAHLASIDAWTEAAAAPNLRPAQVFDVTGTWPFTGLAQQVTAITAINLIHIAPWFVAEALISHAGARLPTGGIFYLYGPYKRAGAHTAASNQSFDQNLKARDSRWGVRDMEAVCALATEAGFSDPVIIPMPANNFSLVFKK